MRECEIREKLSQLSIPDLVTGCGETIAKTAGRGFCQASINAGVKSFCAVDGDSFCAVNGDSFCG